MRRTWILAGLAALVACGSATAELVYFAMGGVAQLPAEIVGDRVELDTPGGPLSFPRSDFLAIVPGHRPLDDWAARRDLASRDGSVASRFAAAWWALENGLTDEASAGLGELRGVAPAHGPTARAVAAIDRLALACPDPDLEPLRGRLRPLRFREARGPHVVLLHQHDEAEASERLDVIERVVKTFHIALAAQGIELLTPSRKLVSVYFAERRDYVESLKKLESQAFDDTQGYYHPVLGAVFAFDARSTAEHQARRRGVANRKTAGVVPSELARLQLLLDLDRRSRNLGIVAHETVHQLTNEGGLAPRFDDFPIWLHEGLAAQFEVIRGGRWAGLGRAHDLRLPDWRAIRPAPRLVPLIRDVGFGRGYRQDVYAESWALVYFLRKTRPREFVGFLDLLRVPRAEATTRPDRVFEAFRSSFGADLAKLEMEWHAYLADLKTPLESNRPEAAGLATAADRAGP